MVYPRTSWLVLLATVVVTAGCPSAPPAPEPATTEPSVAPSPGFHFGWRAGDRFDVVMAKQKKTESLEISTRGVVSAEGGDKLRVHFEPVKLSDKDKKLAAPGASHAFIDVWPDLVVNKNTGELLAIDGALSPAAKEAVAHRWGSWTVLVGDTLAANSQRTYNTEVEAGEGLLVPMRVTERYTYSPELGHRVAFTRVYEGEPTKKLWQIMLADGGASKAEVDAVKQASREEKLMVQTDPTTMHHLRIEESSTFSVTTMDKDAERVDLHGETLSYAFTWTR